MDEDGGVTPVADEPADRLPGPTPVRRRGLRRIAAALAIVVALVAGASSCVGQLGRNDDHVGPTSVRPDARPRS